MAESRTRNPHEMTVKQLRQALQAMGISPPSRARKDELVALYENNRPGRAGVTAPQAPVSSATSGTPGTPRTQRTRTRRTPTSIPTTQVHVPLTARTSQRQPRTRPSTVQAVTPGSRTGSQASQTATPRTRVRYGQPGYVGMTKQQLQEELSRLGYPTSGTREVLVQRLTGLPPGGSAAPVSIAPTAQPTTRRRGRPSRAATVAPPLASIPPTAPVAPATSVAPATTTRRRGRPPSAMAAPSPAAFSPAASTVVPATVTPARGEIPLIPLSLPPPPTPVAPGVAVAPAVGSATPSASATIATTGFPVSPRLSTSSISPRLSTGASTLPTTTTTTESGTSLSPRLTQRAPGTLSPLRAGQGPASGQAVSNGRYRM